MLGDQVLNGPKRDGMGRGHPSQTVPRDASRPVRLDGNARRYRLPVLVDSDLLDGEVKAQHLPRLPVALLGDRDLPIGDVQLEVAGSMQRTMSAKHGAVGLGRVVDRDNRAAFAGNRAPCCR